MKMLRLTKQKHNKPRFDELFEMNCDLKDFLNEPADPNDSQWNDNLKTIIDFQDTDGSFRLFDTCDIPSDARVDFCHMPTYICTATLMKAFMSCPEEFTPQEKLALAKGLEMSCARNMRGHGYGALKGQIEALNIFMSAGLREFLDIHDDICPKFSEMANNIAEKFHEMESEGKFTGPWGESYEDEIRKVNEYFSRRNVFVYGTLMSGETNHHFLENAELISPAAIEGYDMYKVGWYPAIVEGDGMAIGELYRVSKDDMGAIDTLEGEGHLYIKRCETITDANGNSTFALVYVYLEEVSGLERIPAWNRQYVWYVSYGSNMLRERFMHYIRGGYYEDKYSEPCEDTTPPLAVRTVEVPFDMYFGNNSISWRGGVSFLDTTRKGKALGVAYLITKEQLDHVAGQENSGRQPGGGEWYEDFIELEPIGGIEVKTLTNANLRDFNRPSQKYRKTVQRGIRENWPEMTDGEIDDYLDGCMR